MAVATSVVTTLAIHYLYEKRRWRTKCQKYKHAISEAKSKSTQLRLMAEGKSYDWMDDDEGYLPNCWNAAHELIDEYNRPERTTKERQIILQSLLGSCPIESESCCPLHID